jgi:hypothetical protein
MKKTIKISLILGLAVLVAGIITGLYLFNKKGADLSRAKPDFVISAEDLQKAFEADEAGASAMYINKIIEVSGNIVSVKQGERDAVSITIATGNPVSSVIATFPLAKDASLFSEGENLTFRGQCSGYLMDVLLNNCAVVKK